MLVNRLYSAGQAVISTQVMQEFYNVATQKFSLLRAEVAGTAQLYGQTRVVPCHRPLCFLPCDAMPHGLEVKGMTIENPFIGL